MTTRTIGTTAHVDTAGRIVEGVCVPSGELSYLTTNPAGERVLPGAFAGATKPGRDVFLFRNHDHAHPIGRAVSFTEQSDGLHGVFHIRESVGGDETLADLKDAYLPGLPVGFRPTRVRRAAGGETEVVEAQLMEVSLVPNRRLRFRPRPRAPLRHPATRTHPNQARPAAPARVRQWVGTRRTADGVARTRTPDPGYWIRHDDQRNRKGKQKRIHTNNSSICYR